MAIFPNIEQTVSGRDSSATTSHVITMPTGITAGDVLLVIFAGNYAPTIDITSNISWLSAAHWPNESDNVIQTSFLGIASSGTVNLTLGTTTSIEAVHIVYRISDVNLNDVDGDSFYECIGVEGGTNAITSNPDSPSNYTYNTYGEQDYLFIVSAASVNTVASSAPTDFTGLTTISSVTSSTVALSSAYRYYRATTNYNPSTFTASSDDWTVVTRCVLPVLGVGSNYYRKDVTTSAGFGPELITNGDFSSGVTGWALGSGATISDYRLSLNTASNYHSIVDRTVAVGLEIGKTYKVELDILNRTSGSIRFGLGNTSHGAYSSEMNANGHYTFQLTLTDASAPDDIVIFTWSSGAVLMVDNISIKEVL